VFIAALFTISQVMETAKMLLMNGLRNLVFIHNGILLSHKENEILSFASKWMELENIILSEVSQAQKAKNRIFSLLCGL
jgi:hypothetical protein